MSNIFSSSSITDNLNDWFGNFNVFSGVDFTDLYDWLPSDICAVIAIVITVMLLWALLGVIDKFIPW